MKENKSLFRLSGIIIKQKHSICKSKWVKILKSMIWKVKNNDILFHLVALGLILVKKTRLKCKCMLIKEYTEDSTFDELFPYYHKTEII